MAKPPQKTTNISKRPREYLTPNEMEKIINAAKKLGRHGLRDSTMILIAYRHGLRISELISLRWSQIDLKQGLLSVIRRKNGISCTHPLFGPELRTLKLLQRDSDGSDYVFLTERKTPMIDSTFRKIVLRAGKAANLDISIHPHMFRHSTGFKLANDGHDIRSIQLYLGHKNIQHTIRYTEILPLKFNKFWND